MGGSRGTSGQYRIILPSAGGNVSYIALCGGQYLILPLVGGIVSALWGILPGGGFQQSFEALFDTKLS